MEHGEPWVVLSQSQVLPSSVLGHFGSQCHEILDHGSNSSTLHSVLKWSVLPLQALLSDNAQKVVGKHSKVKYKIVGGKHRTVAALRQDPS